MRREVIEHINNSALIREEWEIIFGEQPRMGNVFCPFHVNNDTPAAKIYEDENILFCFSCKRAYTVYDLLKKFNKVRLDELLGQAPISSNYTNPSYKIHAMENDGSLINVLRKIILIK